ncbi:hypothetical protein [Eisenbergiella porci]|uniref:hypothetical protein n=1 Tax=Eisenbergiella porci TaxID=2652274 RepID=UPI002A83D514|nr:hypothetical protein [Eisenbergiella porci]
MKIFFNMPCSWFLWQKGRLGVRQKGISIVSRAGGFVYGTGGCMVPPAAVNSDGRNTCCGG